jgi:hypothetical protein
LSYQTVDVTDELRLISRKQLVGQQIFQDFSVIALTEYVIAITDDVNSAAVSQPPNGRTTLKFEQAKAGFAPCEYENQSNAACANFFEFGA